MDGNQHPAIKVEPDNSIEMGTSDSAEVDSKQEDEAPAKSEPKGDAKPSLNVNPTNLPQQITEVAKLNFREMSVKIFTNSSSEKQKNNSPRFFFEPIVMLDPKSVIIQSQELFKEEVVRFTIQMWTPEIRSKVLDRLRLKNLKFEEDDVTVMPYDEVQLVYKPGSIHPSIKIMEEATPYHRLNEKLDFFLLCDSPSTAKGLAENLRNFPEFVVRKWQLALECRGLALDPLITDCEAIQKERPIFKLFVSSLPPTQSSLGNKPF